MIRCRTARHLIDAALERELPLERRLELETHTVACLPCARREREARTLQEWLEGPGDPPPSAPDVEAAARAVFTRLARSEAPPLRPRRVALVVGLALAAGVLLVLVIRSRTAEERPVERRSPVVEAQGEAESARIEALVRAALLACFDGRGLDVQRAHGRFVEAVREPLREGWPVRRFVEQELAGSEPALGRAAVRCLGAGGEAGAALALERALTRPELAEEALEALGSLALVPAAAEPAVAALERALRTPELAAPAVRELCRAGGERVAECLARAVRRAREGNALSRETLLDALTTTGPAAVASLLGLAQIAGGNVAAGTDAAGTAESDAILARLPLVARAGPELARLLARGNVPADLAYPALAALQSAEGVPWLEERALLSRERERALATLAGLRGSEPLAAALRLAQGGRVPREDVQTLLVRLLESDEERAEPFSRALVAGGETALLRAWLALLLESEHRAAAPALVPLVFAPALPEEDREWAALAVGELGGEREARALALALEERMEGDARLGAACLVSVHEHLGALGVEAVLARAPGPERRRVLAALAGGGRSGGAVRVHRVARALEDALARSAADIVAVKEIL